MNKRGIILIAACMAIAIAANLWVDAEFASPTAASADTSATVSAGTPCPTAGATAQSGSTWFACASWPAGLLWSRVSRPAAATVTTTTVATTTTAATTSTTTAASTTSTTPASTTTGPSTTSTTIASTGWPNASNTGVPAGVTLTAYTGPDTITTPGTVIDAKLLGNICIAADNVTISRSKVVGSIEMAIGPFGGCMRADGAEVRGTLIIDTEVVGLWSPNTSYTLTQLGDLAVTPGIVGANWSCLRCHVHNSGSASIYIHHDVTVTDSLVDGPIGVTGCAPQVGGDCQSHNSCIGGNPTYINATIRHNNVQCYGGNGQAGVSGAIVQYSIGGPNTIDNNLMAGGSYCLQSYGNQVTITNNRFTRTPYPACGGFGPATINGSGPGVVVSGNAFTDGTPVT